MKNNNNNIYIFISSFIIYLIINLNFGIANSEYKNGVLDSEYNCLVDIIEDQMDSDFTKFTKKNGDYEFCVPGFRCNAQGNIIEITLYGNNTDDKFKNEGSPFNCFPKLETLNLINFEIGHSFFKTSVNFTQLVLINCKGVFPLPTTVIENGLKTLKIENGEDSYSGSNIIININYILKLENFDLVDEYRNVSYYIDSAPITGLKLSTLSTSINSIPDLSNIKISTVNLNFNGYLDKSTFGNFSTFNRITSLSFKSKETNRLIPFPNQLSILKNDNYLNTFSSSVSFNRLSTSDTKADFSNLLSLKDFRVTYTYRDLNPSEFPISKLPTNLMEVFSIKGGNFNTFPSIFSNVKNLILEICNITKLQPKLSIYPININLKNNDISGTIDRSYCGTIMDLSNNSRIVSIPTCFTCYASYYTNLYENIPGIQSSLNQPCTTIIPNLSVVNVSGVLNLRLYGNDLGFLPTFIVSNPDLSWKLNYVLGGTEFYSIPDKVHLDLQMMHFQSKISNFNFTLAPYPTIPKIKSVSISNNGDYIIGGEFFTYNMTDIKVSIGDQSLNCSVKFTNFYYILCSKSLIFSKSLLSDPSDEVMSPLEIKIGNLYSKVYFSDKASVVSNNTCTYSKGAPLFGCPSGQSCYLYNATCLLTKNCVNDCSGYGICDSIAGECDCDYGRNGVDCSILTCPSDCSSSIGQGSCDGTTGSCKCLKDYTGLACELPDIRVSSIVQPNENGGSVIFVGWFGLVNNDLKVKIGDSYCTDIIVNSTTIKCNIVAGTGIKPVNITQNTVTSWYRSNIFKYEELTKSCSPNCELHGSCDKINGKCDCEAGYIGSDCMSTSSTYPTIPGSNPNINSSTGSGSINNEQTNYLILLKSLVEIDINNNIVFEYQFQDKWKIRNDSTTSKSVFTQNIINTLANDNTSIINSILEEVQIDTDYTFAGIDFQVLGGSIKVTIEILNYPFSSSLNSLQLRMESKVTDKDDEVVNSCNDYDNDVKISSDQLSNDNNYLNNLKIEKNAKILYSRFLDKCMSDGRPTFITNSLISKSNDSVIIAINLPHCVSSCLIDPDFSVLVSPDFKAADSCSNDDKKWFLPVVIVVPVVGACCILILGYIVYKKNQTNIKIGLVKLNLIKN